MFFNTQLLVGLLFSLLPVVLCKPPFAQGNLAVILNVSEGIVSPHHGIKGEFSQQSLWCQATEDGETALELHNASFQRTYFPHRHEAEIDNGNRAYFKFGKPSTRDIGKYKCDMVTSDGRRAWGNLFVYMRPVFHTNGSTRFEVPDDDDKFTVTATSIKFSEGDTVTLSCPAISYPAADIEWFKNDKRIVSDNGRISKRDPNLYIDKVTKADEGSYRCRATNRFPVGSDDETEFHADLITQLRINGTLGWVYPLILIIVILLLLFITIYVCSAFKKRKQNQYNVAKREKTLRNAEEERLNDVDGGGGFEE
jgi:hypothetical protein